MKNENISINAIFCNQLDAYDFANLVLDCYIVGNIEFDYLLFRRYYENKVLHKKFDDSPYSFVLERELDKVFYEVSKTAKLNWDKVMSFYSCRFETYDLEYGDFLEFRGAMSEEAVDMCNLELFWGLNVFHEHDCGCDSTGEENNNN